MIIVEGLLMDDATLVEDHLLSFTTQISAVHSVIIGCLAASHEIDNSEVLKEAIRIGLDRLLRDEPY